MKRYIFLFIVVVALILGLSAAVTILSFEEVAFAIGLGAAVSGGIFLLNRVLFRRYPKVRKYLLAGVIGLLLLVLLYLGWLGAKPLRVKGLISSPNQAISYEEAVIQIEAIQARDDQSINPLCKTQFLSHGAKTDKAILFLHGLANCPEQFRPLGELFYRMGYNVLIPRAPHHGQADPLTEDLVNLTAEELAAFGDESADALQGLGNEKIVVGFSMGGVVASWLAQNRSDIDRVVLIAPALGLRVVPHPLTNMSANLYLALPNFFAWWNPLVGKNHPVKHGYPRFSSHALGQIMRLGATVRYQAAKYPPGVQDIVLITNEGDLAVNNALAKKLGDQWQKQGASVNSYTFPLRRFLSHDFIDLDAIKERAEEVYPELAALIINDQ